MEGVGGVHLLSRSRLVSLYSKMFASFPYRSVCPVDYEAFYMVPVLAQTLPSLEFEYTPNLPDQGSSQGNSGNNGRNSGIPADSTHIRAVVRDLPLTTAEQKGLMGALESNPMSPSLTLTNGSQGTHGIQGLETLTRVYNTHKESHRDPLLCVSFLKAEESAVDIFLNNVRASDGHCDWAVVAYGGSDSQLSRLKAEFESIRLQWQVQ